MTDVTYARLTATDPGHWRTTALAWRGWAELAGRWSAEVAQHARTLPAVWSGVAATAAALRLTTLRRGLDLFRLLCWEVDQALSEFAAALGRAKALLAQAVGRAPFGNVSGVVSRIPSGASGFEEGSGAPAGVGDAAGTGTGSVPEDGAGDEVAANPAAAGIAAALGIAAEADSTAAARVADVAAAASDPGVPPPPAEPLPSCTATPAQVRHWWDTLTPEQRRWLVATEPGWLGPLDGVPAGYRDLANRLLLDDRRAELDRAAEHADKHQLRRIRDLRRGLDRLEDRLADGDGPRAYLLRLDLAEEGQAVVALSDPDRADNVLTHVPGMTADLASYGGELAHAERVAVRAAELGPAAATSTVMWLGYDAPDFLDEAATASRAEAGAARLRQFQQGLRATHEGGPARQTILGHSYGSLVVGSAAKTPGFEADSVVFVGSPGVGVESAAQLHVPQGQVWSTTSRSDVIQYTAVSPRSLIEDLVLAHAVPVVGPYLAFGRPEDDLWFGHNPSDQAFGAHVFQSQPDGGHLGYWDAGSPALDGITAITLGTAQ